MKRLAKGELRVLILEALGWNEVLTQECSSALPSKPLNQISLSDADNASALSFVEQKLHDSGMDVKFSQAQLSYIARLGGRASDLESVRTHRLCSPGKCGSLTSTFLSAARSQGAQWDDCGGGCGRHRYPRRERAAQECVRGRHRGCQEPSVDEGAGLDSDEAAVEATGGAYTYRLQSEAAVALTVFADYISSSWQISYHEVLADYPFKGDETPLRHMEHAELITIGTHNGTQSQMYLRALLAKLEHRPSIDHQAWKARVQVRVRATRGR